MSDAIRMSDGHLFDYGGTVVLVLFKPDGDATSITVYGGTCLDAARELLPLLGRDVIMTIVVRRGISWTFRPEPRRRRFVSRA